MEIQSNSMNRANNYIEALGVAGVVASLIFVGIQIQQTNEATRSATVLQLKDSWVQYNIAYATSPELNLAEQDVLTNGWDGANSQSRRLFVGSMRTLFHIWSNAYFQYKNGTLDTAQWTPIHREIVDAMQYEGVRHAWEETRFLYEDEFQIIVDNEIVQIE